MTAGRRWTGSIRFRLAAWYAAIVFLVILSLGVSFSILLERELRADVDSRILEAAVRVKGDVDVHVAEDGAIVGAPPIPSFYSFPSLLIQIERANGDVLASTESLWDVDAEQYRILPTRREPGGSTQPQFETVELNDVEIRTVRLPLVLQNSGLTIGSVNVGEPLIQLEQTLDHIRRLLIVGGALGVAFAAAAGWFLAGRALRPVDKITATAHAIAEGRGVGDALSARLEVGRSGDELARLSETINQMLDRLQETFEQQRRFIADASHELRTPLTAIRGNVEVLSRQIAREGPAESEVGETLEDLRRESERMSRLIEELLILARAESEPNDEERMEPVRLDEIAGEAIRVGATLAKGQQLDFPFQPELVVRGNRDRLFQVLLILIDNAVRHTPEGGRITVYLSSELGNAVVRVSDTGSGIPEEHLAHLFERFYRADASRQRMSGGTGLGLAIARAIVEQHKGTIAVTSTVGIGTTMTVTLPLAPQPARLESVSVTEPELVG